MLKVQNLPWIGNLNILKYPMIDPTVNSCNGSLTNPFTKIIKIV